MAMHGKASIGMQSLCGCTKSRSAAISAAGAHNCMEVEVDGLLGSSVAADADAMVAGAMMTKAQIQTKQLQLAIIGAKDQSTSKPLWP